MTKELTKNGLNIEIDGFRLSQYSGIRLTYVMCSSDRINLYNEIKLGIHTYVN